MAGTEAGITEPKTVFSACFGAPFLPLHPGKYADMLGEKMKQNDVRIWLVNTGWSGGAYGVGERIKLRYTRAMISAALNGELDNVEYDEHRIFGLKFPTSCPEVPASMLNARTSWKVEAEYTQQAEKLANAFVANFEKYKDGVSEETLAGAPKSTMKA